MNDPYKDFVDLKYKPQESDIICLFRVEPAKGISIKEAIGRVASESSNGTWAELTTLREHIRKIRARAFWIKGNYVKVAYPIELFEEGSIPQLMSSIAGNIFGMKALKNLRLEDVEFPKEYVKHFKGPQFGIDGVFGEIFGMKKRRPLLAHVPKPKVGMYTNEHANVAKEAWLGGVDLLKDDENLTSQRFNRFEDRMKLMFKYRDFAEKETGEKKSYLANITAETNEMIRRAKLVKDLGGEYVMVDILTAGWAALQTVRDTCEDLGLAIHAHRAFHAAFTRNPRHGMSMLVVAKLARLIGVDQIHIGTVIGKLKASKKEVIDLDREITLEHIEEHKRVLAEDWYNIKPVVPVSSGGLHPGLVPYVLNLLGNEIVVQAGGGIDGHPGGVRRGAEAMRQAIEAMLNKVSLQEYAEEKGHKALKEALDYWGFEKPV
ncbi:MAG: type III ribulose-bisphosphate carboxylase [Candidatus Micrarchaeia archaeon]|jgi:ribulose-bisphosphate carboxylase large chain